MLARPPAYISLVLLALVACSFALQVARVRPFAPQPGDAMVYWTSAEALQRGEDIYDTGGWESFGRPYIYPPAFAAAFVPFTWFDDRPQMDSKQRGLLRPYPYPTSLYVWVGLIGAMWAAIALLVARGLADSWRERLWLAAAGSVCIWGAFYLDAWYGNVNTLILLMMVGGLALVLKERGLAGGTLIGAAAMIKVLPVVFLLAFALQRRWRACGGMLAGAALAWCLPLCFTIPAQGLVGGVAANFEMSWTWISKFLLPSLSGSKMATIDVPYVFANNSVTAALHRLFGEGTLLRLMVWDEDDVGPLLFALPGPLLRAVGMLIPGAMFVAALVGMLRRRSAQGQWGMAGLMFMAISAANALFWHYHFVAFLLPVAAALASARTSTDKRLVWLGAGALFVLALGPNVAAAGFGSHAAIRMLVWCVPTLGFLIGWWCLWVCLWRSTRPQEVAGGAPAEGQVMKASRSLMSSPALP